jgi:Pilus biogenesis CpaD protein (pilus_cpaD)
MYKSSLNPLATLMLLCALPLAGCVGDQLIADEPITPYGGSKAHPIKLVNGEAVVEDCGAWPENLADTTSNEMNANHGCAVQANIAAMAAYPQDLVRLRRMGPNPAFTRIQGIKSLTSGGAAAPTVAPAAAAPVAAAPSP